MEDPDAKLMLQFQGGCNKSFNKLYKKYYDHLSAFLTSYVEYPEKVEDFVQEVFFKVIKSAHTYEYHPQATFKTWLFAIAKNTALSKKHKKSYQPNLLVRNKYEEYSDQPNRTIFICEDLEPDEILHLKRTLIETLKRMHGINEDQKQAVILRDFYNFTYDEISKVLSIPLNTVKSRIARGRNKITRGGLTL